MDVSDRQESCSVESRDNCAILTLTSSDPTNVLSTARVDALLNVLRNLKTKADSGKIRALIITGNQLFFSAGADLNEIAKLTGPAAFEFARKGQQLMLALDRFPVPVFAAVTGYCMGGGLDLALACDFRIAEPSAVFGHRGAALGLMTGWGGTQRLPRLIGKPRAMQMFLTAETLSAAQALEVELIDDICDDPVPAAIRRVASGN